LPVITVFCVADNQDCALKFQSSGIPWDELCACGNLGLVQAAITFLPEKKTQFSTYAGRCIDNEIYKLLRQRKKHSPVTESLDCEISGTEGMRYHDVLSDDVDMADAVELRMLASDALAKIQTFPERKRRIWELYLGLAGEPPITQKLIAKRVGCSRSLISRNLKEDLPKLKREVF